MGFQLKEATRPPTRHLGPLGEIQRGRQQFEELYKTTRCFAPKQDLCLESTDMFALLQREAGSHDACSSLLCCCQSLN